MTYKVAIVLDGIVEADSEEQAKEKFAEEMGDKFLCWFVPEDVEVEPYTESEDKNE